MGTLRVPKYIDELEDLLWREVQMLPAGSKKRIELLESIETLLQHKSLFQDLLNHKRFQTQLKPTFPADLEVEIEPQVMFTIDNAINGTLH